jgi:hypothetical protein
MSDYYFYRYGFRPVDKEQTLPFGEGGAAAESPRVILERRLAEAWFPVTHRRKDGTADSFNNRIYYHGGIGLMQLQNNITFQRTDINFRTDREEDHPYLNVIIDNRHDRQMIGIEKNSAFRKRRGDHNSTRRVAEYLEESACAYLRTQGYAMEITPVARRGELWPAMIDRIRTKNQRVRSIEYVFPSEDSTPGSQSDTALHLLMNLARENGAADGMFRMTYRNGDEAELRNAERDFKATEMFLSREHYEINVQFTDMSIIRSNQLLYAHHELPERDLSNFIGGQRGLTGDFELNGSLDNIFEALKDYGQQ